jgi:hypothetical protein
MPEHERQRCCHEHGRLRKPDRHGAGDPGEDIAARTATRARQRQQHEHERDGHVGRVLFHFRRYGDLVEPQRVVRTELPDTEQRAAADHDGESDAKNDRRRHGWASES